MSQAPRFVVAGTLVVVLAGGMTLATAPAALADDGCTGLLHCAGKDVGDTVRNAAKGDVDGTVKHAGKTARDATREAGRTVHRAAGQEPDEATGEPAPEPSAGQSEGSHEHASGSTGTPAQHEPAAGHSNHQPPGHHTNAKQTPQDKRRTSARKESGISSLALRQWHEHSLPLGPGWPNLTGTARSGTRSLPDAGFPSSAAMPQRDRAPAPRVAADRQTAGAHGAVP
ncbi:MAG: hypothetical protein ACRDMV_06175, partial [Streptosporangiales bacterium]